MNETLNNIIESSNKETEKTRKIFKKTGYVLHFGGEIVGLLSLIMIKGLAWPTIQNWNNTNIKFDYNAMLMGAGVYVLTQIPAFYLKGMSMTKEENILLAQQFEEDRAAHIKKERNITAALETPFIKFHYHIANNYERYNKITKYCSKFL